MMWQRLSREELQKLLDYAGSWKAFREILGVSHSDMVRLLQTHELKFKKLDTWTKELLEAELTRIGSSKVFCIIHSCKESELRSRLKALEMDMKVLASPHASTIGVGRKGELYFKTVREDKIVKDMFEEEGHSASYDLLDKDFERVNVKTAQVNRFKAKTRANNPKYWHFSTKGHENCDWLAFVPLDAAGNPLMVLMGRASEVAKHFPTHVVITGNDLRPTSRAVTSGVSGEFSQLHYIWPERLLNVKEKLEEPESEPPATASV